MSRPVTIRELRRVLETLLQAPRIADTIREADVRAALAALPAEQSLTDCPWHGTSVGSDCWRCANDQPAASEPSSAVPELPPLNYYTTFSNDGIRTLVDQRDYDSLRTAAESLRERLGAALKERDVAERLVVALTDSVNKAERDALRSQIEQAQRRQEPLAWRCRIHGVTVRPACTDYRPGHDPECLPLYAAPVPAADVTQQIAAAESLRERLGEALRERDVAERLVVALTDSVNKAERDEARAALSRADERADACFTRQQAAEAERDALRSQIDQAQRQEPWVWTEGQPPHPYGNEWFIAELRNGGRAVLHALPEHYAYDFTTEDGTHYKADAIARWMQFPDSIYVAYAATADVAQQIEQAQPQEPLLWFQTLPDSERPTFTSSPDVLPAGTPVYRDGLLDAVTLIVQQTAAAARREALLEVAREFGSLNIIYGSDVAARCRRLAEEARG